MPTTESMLSEILALQRASLRLQKFAITLQAESLASLQAIALGDRDEGRLKKNAMKTVVQIRKTLERVERGRGLPK